jgi:hypothetical protein
MAKKRWTVGMDLTVCVSGTVNVEADTEDEARKRAYEKVNSSRDLNGAHEMSTASRSIYDVNPA